jgi:hypothetical protein
MVSSYTSTLFRQSALISPDRPIIVPDENNKRSDVITSFLMTVSDHRDKSTSAPATGDRSRGQMPPKARSAYGGTVVRISFNMSAGVA